MKPHRVTSRFLASLALAVGMLGCVSAQGQPILNYGKEIDAPRSKWSTAEPEFTKRFYLRTTVGGHDYDVEMKVYAWTSSPRSNTIGGAHAPVPKDYVPYFYFESHEGIFSGTKTFYVKPEDMVSAGGSKGEEVYPWVIQLGDQTVKNVERLQIAMCAPDATPDPKTCVYNLPSSQTWFIYYDHGVQVRQENDSYKNLSIATTWDLAFRQFGPYRVLNKTESDEVIRQIAKAKKTATSQSDKEGGKWVVQQGKNANNPVGKVNNQVLTEKMKAKCAYSPDNEKPSYCP
ncbi:hypothetical protein QU487_02325 [Crenobacter sp. SG2305]|uniref:hypothetical protein n=1 Tax=Crenobacter oryzisoli TaxID=3056844 RepID=UPI0025AAE855|nr:hypothetical protein [Crenobacter sp. SG2305]MDN0081596.1 hypothetical protein [Crenobacter sp. SG2305]